jgi:ABC-2 type transport system permease protein
MRNIFAVFSKDLKLYFTSFIAYCVIGIFLVITGFFFSSLINVFGVLSLQVIEQGQYQGPLNLTEMITPALFMNVCIVMLFMLPILTMRSFSEEKKEGTIELLFTYPISDFQIVAGKFLSLLAVYIVMLLPLLVYPVLISLVGGVLVFKTYMAGMLGLVLLGAAFISIGLFISSLTKNQIVAVSITFGALLFFWIIGWSASFVSAELAAFINAISLLEHFGNFAQGLIDTQDVLFYILFIFYFLFFTLRVVESRNWRG